MLSVLNSVSISFFYLFNIFDNTFNSIFIFFRWRSCMLPHAFLYFHLKCWRAINNNFRIERHVMSITAVSQRQLCPCAVTLPLIHHTFSMISFDISSECIPQLYAVLLSKGDYIKHSWRPKVWDITEMISQPCDRGHEPAPNFPLLIKLTGSFSESGQVSQIAAWQTWGTRIFPAFDGKAGKLICDWYQTASRCLSRWSEGLLVPVTS